MIKTVPCFWVSSKKCFWILNFEFIFYFLLSRNLQLWCSFNPGQIHLQGNQILSEFIFHFFTFLCLLHFFVGVSALFSCLLYLCLCLPNFFCVYLTFFLSTLPFLFLCNIFCVYLTFFCFYLTFLVST